ncbi:MAG: hypothetical protein M1827_000032 [Pycnora praestabilis]|nr:MAG: hypothetical protein M1827_000032 [Pycnora praestabilis]
MLQKFEKPSKRITWNQLAKQPTSSLQEALELKKLSVRCITTSSQSKDYTGKEKWEAARRWLADFNSSTIPQNICEISFSRSSGPGGQNVNKVNSKATLHLPLGALLPLIPDVLHQRIQESRHFATKSNAIVIQADGSRKQGENVDECFVKLRGVIMEAARSVIPGPTKPGKNKRVEGLQNADNEARLRMKKTHSSKKSARKGGGSFNY